MASTVVCDMRLVMATILWLNGALVNPFRRVSPPGHDARRDTSRRRGGNSLMVLTQLAAAERRLGRRMGSRALYGDGTLSGIAAATSFLALAALLVSRLLCWWQADRPGDIRVAEDSRQRRCRGTGVIPKSRIVSWKLIGP
jgi:hypothetical protein